jgi:tRNA pseudouridine55 synthase
MDGAIVVDKPAGWTSHDVVNKLRRLAGTRRIGHLGTLDPMATGVLPLLLDRATRLAQFFSANEKVYEGTIRFGFATSTYDAAGEPEGEDLHPRLDPERLEQVAARFRGSFAQTPPPVSAKKIGGVPAYKLARRNAPVELAPVTVTVEELVFLEVAGSEARIRVRCSSGTYVRSLAHDLGVLYGCGAHLAGLRRTRSGSFDLSAAHPIAGLESLAAEGRLAEAVIPAAQLLPEIPAEILDPAAAAQVRHGRDFRGSPFRPRGSEYLKAVTPQGELVAIGKEVLPNLYHPLVVLA